MDVDWARTRLHHYLALLLRFAPRSNPTGQISGGDRSVIPELQKREWSVKQILSALDPALANFTFVAGRIGVVPDIIGKVERGLGILDDREEVAARLAPESPQMPADRLHPWVWEAARSLWETRHFRQAVQTAFTSLNARLQDKVGRRDVSDDKLIGEVFSDKDAEPGKPRLRIPGDPKDQTVASRQRGALLFGMGCAFAIRNPASHEQGEWDEQEALEQLAALSVFARMVEQSAVVRAENDKSEA